MKKFSGFGPFLSQLFATRTKSLKKFDEKKIDVDTRTEVSNQFSKYPLTLLTFILESKDKTPAHFSCKIFSLPGANSNPFFHQYFFSGHKFFKVFCADSAQKAKFIYSFLSDFSYFTNLFTAFGCCLFFRNPNALFFFLKNSTKI